MGEKFGHTLLTKGDTVSEDLPRIICLWGELGSGKTTFVQGIAKGLGITHRLLSPTFIIVRRYEIPQQSCSLYHVDLYRTESREDLLTIGITELFFDVQSIVLVEWPERLGDLLPKRRIDFFLSVQPDETHRIEGRIHG